MQCGYGRDVSYTIYRRWQYNDGISYKESTHQLSDRSRWLILTFASRPSIDWHTHNTYDIHTSYTVELTLMLFPARQSHSKWTSFSNPARTHHTVLSALTNTSWANTINCQTYWQKVSNNKPWAPRETNLRPSEVIKKNQKTKAVCWILAMDIKKEKKRSFKKLLM